MKQIKLFTALVLAFIFSMLSQAHAQEVYSKESQMSQGKHPCFAIDIKGADKKLAEKKWKEVLKDRGKVKRDKKSKEWRSFAAEIPSFGGDVDLYLKLEEGMDMTRAIVFVKNAEMFVSEEDAQAEAVTGLLTDFYNLVQRDVVEKEIKQEEKKLKNFQKGLRNQEKKNKNLHKDIEKYKRKIEEAEAAIQQNLIDQDSSREQIGSQERVIDKTKDKLNNIGRNN